MEDISAVYMGKKFTDPHIHKIKSVPVKIVNFTLTNWLVMLLESDRPPSPPSLIDWVRPFLLLDFLDDADDGNVVPAELLCRLGSSGSAFEAAGANPRRDIFVV